MDRQQDPGDRHDTAAGVVLTAPDGDAAPVSQGLAAVAGALAAGLSLGVAELLAGLFGSLPSLVTVVGGAVIDLAPPIAKDFAIAVFGTADKAALQIGTVVLSLAAGALIGRAAVRRFWIAVVGFTAFAVVGVAATAFTPQEGVGGALAVSLPAAAAGLAALRAMLRRLPAVEPGAEDDTARRGFLQAAGVTFAAAVAAGAVGRRLVPGAAAGEARADVALPSGVDDAPTPPPGTTVNVADMPPLYTPNDEFYRIDTALRIPQPDLAEWRLRVHGLVDSPYEWTYEELLSQADTEYDITMSCVSNEVGGGLVDNARWFGVPLQRVLDRARVRDDGTWVVGRAVDGFTVSFPTAVGLDGRDALVAVGMNGEPLPARHGFPARLVVAGLYGYVSATKWLSEIELATEDFEAYWVPRGWAKEGPVKTQSRIDVPRPSAVVRAGRVPVAGVAWAPSRGIERVEVRIGDGEWVEAELADALDVDTWRQWVHRWDATPGDYEISVRATDSTGEVQTAEQTPPRPDGATGRHTIRVTVTE